MTSLVLPPRQVNRMGSAYFEGNRAVLLSATKPIVRSTEIGGGALVVGDIWIQTTTGAHWRWESPYWQLTNEWCGSEIPANVSASSNVGIIPLPISSLSSNFLIKQVRLFCPGLTTNDGSNNWDIQPQTRLHLAAGGGPYGFSSSQNTSASGTAAFTLQFDTSHVVDINAHRFLGLIYTKNGAPSNLTNLILRAFGCFVL